MSEETKAEAAATPQKRERKPSLKTKSATRHDTNDTAARQNHLQAQAVEKHEAGLSEVQRQTLALTTPIKLSTSGYVGKAPGEPHKDEMEEANKKGETPIVEHDRHAFVTPKEFNTIPQEAHGKVVDRIVVSDTLVENGVPGATLLTEPQKTQAVVDAHLAKGKKGKKGKKTLADE